MLKIALCDDEEIFLEKLRTVIEGYLGEKQILYELDLYSSGTELAGLAVGMAKYNIVFLDINMDGLNGIETAQKLRGFCPDTYLVFVTAFIDYTLEGYKVDAVRYILKNGADFSEAVRESLDAILVKMDYASRVLEYAFKEGGRKLGSERIMYIESDLHNLHFHVLEDKVTAYTLGDTLNHIEERLAGEKFLRIHQSYLVNYRFVGSIGRDSLTLHDGTVLPLARSRRKDVMRQFAIYEGEM